MYTVNTIHRCKSRLRLRKQKRDTHDPPSIPHEAEEGRPLANRVVSPLTQENGNRGRADEQQRFPDGPPRIKINRDRKDAHETNRRTTPRLNVANPSCCYSCCCSLTKAMFFSLL